MVVGICFNLSFCFCFACMRWFCQFILIAPRRVCIMFILGFSLALPAIPSHIRFPSIFWSRTRTHTQWEMPEPEQWAMSNEHPTHGKLTLSASVRWERWACAGRRIAKHTLTFLTVLKVCTVASHICALLISMLIYIYLKHALFYARFNFRIHTLHTPQLPHTHTAYSCSYSTLHNTHLMHHPSHTHAHTSNGHVWVRASGRSRSPMCFCVCILDVRISVNQLRYVHEKFCLFLTFKIYNKHKFLIIYARGAALHGHKSASIYVKALKLTNVLPCTLCRVYAHTNVNYLKNFPTPGDTTITMLWYYYY